MLTQKVDPKEVTSTVDGSVRTVSFRVDQQVEWGEGWGEGAGRPAGRVGRRVGRGGRGDQLVGGAC